MNLFTPHFDWPLQMSLFFRKTQYLTDYSQKVVLWKETLQRKYNSASKHWITSSSSIISAITALISLFYLYKIGSFFQVPIFPLINRVTYTKNFNFSVIDGNFDYIIIISLFLLWLIFSIKQKKVKFLSAGFLLGFVGVSFLQDSNLILDVITLTCVPIIIILSLYNKYSKNEVLNNFSFLTGKYITLLGLALGIISIIVVSTPLFSLSSLQLVQRNHVYEIFMLFASAICLMISYCFCVTLVDMILFMR